MLAFHHYCIDNDISVSVVESCTAGLLASNFTTYSGSSKWFKGGLITYTNEIKSKLLSIDIDFIKRHGPVSIPVVNKMVTQGMKIFETDICFGISGYIEPVEKAHCFICVKKKAGREYDIVTHRLELNGRTRYENKQQIMEYIFSVFVAGIIKTCDG